MGYSEKDERAIFEKFKHVALPYLSFTPRNDLEWLAIAQHYGVPTRLLDWTENLLIATWFSIQRARWRMESEKNTSSDTNIIPPAIWIIRDAPSISEGDAKNPFDVNHPKVYRPPHVSPRIAAQQGVFTIHPKPDEECTFQGAIKIEIKPSCCFELSKRLDGSGINERLLFPELAGVGGYMEFLYRNNWLGGYKENNPVR